MISRGLSLPADRCRSQGLVHIKNSTVRIRIMVIMFQFFCQDIPQLIPQWKRIPKELKRGSLRRDSLVKATQKKLLTVTERPLSLRENLHDNLLSPKMFCKRVDMSRFCLKLGWSVPTFGVRIKEKILPFRINSKFHCH